MTIFIIGVISGIAAFLLFGYIINKIVDKKYNEEKDKDFETIPKSEDINRNVTICLKDNDIYTTEHLDDNKNIIGFMNFNPKNIEHADFYYSLFVNKQVITIDYNLRMYKAIITEIKLTDYDTLRIYYTVLKQIEKHA